jgi:hypothetical protein
MTDIYFVILGDDMEPIERILISPCVKPYHRVPICKDGSFPRVAMYKNVDIEYTTCNDHSLVIHGSLLHQSERKMTATHKYELSIGDKKVLVEDGVIICVS